MSSFRVDIMTLFPDTMQALLGESILGRAAKKDILRQNKGGNLLCVES